jgi:glutathione synthase/RimK-type ligase-like ATP-grasp enzyme
VRLALPTYARHPAWEVDDHPLHRALRACGATVEVPIWDDPDVQWSSYDLVLIRTVWDYHQKLPQFRAWAHAVAAQTALHNPASVVDWNTDKTYLQRLAAEGVPVAPTAWLPQGSAPPDLDALLAGAGWSRALLKPVVGASSSDTLRVRPGEGAAAGRWLGSVLPRVGMMVQPYLRSVETQGETSVIFVDGEPCHGVRKVPVPGDYRVQDDHGAHDEPWDPPEDERALARAALAAAARLWPTPDGRPLLYARVDMLRDDAGDPVLVELEVVEPSLFLRHGPATAERLAAAALARAGA